jgi:RimJ/RimL family protein N-acetyltransferase
VVVGGGTAERRADAQKAMPRAHQGARAAVRLNRSEAGRLVPLVATVALPRLQLQPMSNPLVNGFFVRPIEIGDVAAWAAYVCLPEVKRHTSMTASSEAEVEVEVRRMLVDGPDAPVRFVLQDCSSGEVVATVGFHSISARFATAEIAYDVAPSQWGKGIATRACQAASLWGFEVRGWQRIQATTMPSNTASRRVLERCGFKREGLLRHLRIVRGQPADYWMFSALPGEIVDTASSAPAAMVCTPSMDRADRAT